MQQSEEIHNGLILLYHEDSKVYIAIKDDFLPMTGIDLKKNRKLRLCLLLNLMYYFRDVMHNLF